MATDPHELAKRRHVLRVRIHGDERRLAVAYPEQREQLESDLERERAMLAELDEQLSAADESVCAEYRETVDRLFSLRDTLLKLRGHFRDEGFRDTVFTVCEMSKDGARVFGGIDTSRLDPIETTRVKNALLRVADMEPAPEPTVSDSQRLHEEALRNERAGRGYWTDEQLAQMAEDPDRFHHGAGFRRVRQMNG